MNYSIDFLKCLKIILDNEGGYSNDPHDPGGATNKGITQKVYDTYRIKKGLPIRSVEEIEDSEVQEIYYISYFKYVESIVNIDLKLQVFDHGVNTGIITSIRLLQRLLDIDDDGIIGSNTLEAINKYSGNIVEGFKKRRKLFYITLAKNRPELQRYLKGWLNRVDKTKF